MQDFFVHHQSVFQFLEHCLAIFGAYKALEIAIPWARGYARRNWQTLGIALCIGLIAYAAVAGDAWGRGHNYGYTPKIKGTDKEAYTYWPKKSSYRRSVTASPAPSPDLTETSRRDSGPDDDLRFKIRALEAMIWTDGDDEPETPEVTRPSEHVTLASLLVKEPEKASEAVTFEMASMSPAPDTVREQLTAWKTVLEYLLYTITLIAVVSVALCLGLLAGPDLCYVVWDKIRRLPRISPAIPMPEHWFPRGVIHTVIIYLASLPLTSTIDWAFDVDHKVACAIIGMGMAVIGRG